LHSGFTFFGYVLKSESPQSERQSITDVVERNMIRLIVHIEVKFIVLRNYPGRRFDKRADGARYAVWMFCTPTPVQ